MRNSGKKTFGLVVAVTSLFVSSHLFASESSKDLKASLAELPGLAEFPEKGAFVDLVKALDEAYTEGVIKIQITPFARSVGSVINGTADFHIPTIRNPAVDQSQLPYSTVKVSMGSVYFNIYSNTQNLITKKKLDAAMASGKNKMPYQIEGVGGIESQYPFHVIGSNSVENSLKKLSAGRIDALIWAQEETDAALKKLRLKNIHREPWMSFDDAIVIPKGARGEQVDKILSKALLALKKNGKLDVLYPKIHRPYEDWQPAKMGW